MEDLSWKGIYYIYDKTENVSRALSNDKPEFESFVQNYNTKLLEVEEIPYTTLKKTYEDLKNLTVINPDPANVDNQPLINPEYIIVLYIYIYINISSIWGRLVVMEQILIY